jgi:ligand-binding SRPBCC domain-containing protein
VDVVTAVEIAQPREVVSAYASDPTNVTAWYENIKSVEWKTPPPITVGTKVAFAARFLGRDLSYTYEVQVVDLGQRLVMRTEEGPFPMETTYLWEDTATGGTRMTLRNRGEPQGFSKIAGPVISLAMRRANSKDLAKLRQILEAAEK